MANYFRIVSQRKTNVMQDEQTTPVEATPEEATTETSEATAEEATTTEEAAN